LLFDKFSKKENILLTLLLFFQCPRNSLEKNFGKLSPMVAENFAKIITAKILSQISPFSQDLL